MNGRGVVTIDHDIMPKASTMEEHISHGTLAEVLLPNLSHISVTERFYNLAVIHLARFFNCMEHATSTAFPVLQTLHIRCDLSYSDRHYDEVVSAFLHHTPASVSCLELELIDNLLDFGRGDFDIVSIRADKPKLALASMALKLRDHTSWCSLEVVYNLDDLVQLNLCSPTTMSIDCSILPRSLQHLNITVNKMGHHVQNSAEKSILHFKNAPIHMESLVVGHMDIVMHEPLPSMLRTLNLKTYARINDDHKFIAISLLPRNLKLFLVSEFVDMNGTVTAQWQHLFGDLMNQPHEQVVAALKQWPARLPVIVVDSHIAYWLSSFVHMKELSMFAVMHSYSFMSLQSIYEYAMQQDVHMEATKRQALQALAATAAQTNWLLKPKVAPVDAGPITDILNTIALTDIDTMTVYDNSTWFTRYGYSERTVFVLDDYDDLYAIVPACSRMRFMNIRIHNPAILDALLSSLPPSLQELVLAIPRLSTSVHLDVRRLNANMRLGHFEITGFIFDAASFKSLVEDVKSIVWLNQLVVTATVDGGVHNSARSFTVHCHSVDLNELLK